MIAAVCVWVEEVKAKKEREREKQKYVARESVPERGREIEG